VGYYRMKKNRKSALRGNSTAELEDLEYLRGFTHFFHSQAHFKMGRDMLDVATSPNDAAAFAGYHADIDRNNMHWMAGSRLHEWNWTYPSAETADHTGKPPFGASGPYSVYDRVTCKAATSDPNAPWSSGTLYGDVVNSGLPFFDLFYCDEAASCDGGNKGYTHSETLYWSSPERTPYTYDTLEHLYYC